MNKNALIVLCKNLQEIAIAQRKIFFFFVLDNASEDGLSLDKDSYLQVLPSIDFCKLIWNSVRKHNNLIRGKERP